VINDSNETAHTLSTSNIHLPTVPDIQVSQPDDDPHTKSFAHSTNAIHLVKLQVAEPPDASRSEVEEARLRLPRKQSTSVVSLHALSIMAIIIIKKLVIIIVTRVIHE